MHDTAEDIYLPEPATVIRVEPMTAQETFFAFALDSDRELGHMPGQFAQISVAGFGEAPISVSSSPTREGPFEMVVRKVGNVTAAMHRLRPGDRVGVRGPFGNHFPVDGAMRGRDILFLCGGIGLVPMRSAIQYVLDRRADYGRIVMVLFGTKTPADRLFVNELAEWTARDDVEVLETVDHGDGKWQGCTGVITTLLPRVKIDPAGAVALICGPPVMYKFVVLGLREMDMADGSMYVSLERRMKCGVGKCGHCQINGLYACRDGPVFRYSDVAEVREAI